MGAGKVLGAMLGLMLGLYLRHPAAIVLGLLGGVLLGHLLLERSPPLPPDPLDSLPLRPDSLAEPPSFPLQPASRDELDAQAQEDFARHLCALLIEVARADGEVGRDEVRVAREYFEYELKYGPEALELVRGHLKEFLHQPPSLEASATACREEMPTAERLLLLDVLYQLALADGPLQRSEQEALRRVAQGLGLEAQAVRAIASRHLGDGEAHYARLGLSPEASDAEVKSAFRALATAHHPDKVAHLGPGAVEQATLRFREVKDAYEEIRRLRGL